MCRHRRTIQTVQGIIMSCVTSDTIQLMYFMTPTLSLIQVIGRNASKNTEFCTLWSHPLNKTNLPYVFSVVSCRTHSFFLHYITIWDQKVQNCVFYEAFLPITWIKPSAGVTNGSHVARDITMPRTVRMVCLWCRVEKKNPMQRTMSLKFNLTSWSICSSDCLFTTDRNIFSVFRINWEQL